MLYDPKWETKVDPLSLGSLTAWLERQPASRKYNYVCNGHCLLAQYFSAMGFSGVDVTSFHVSHSDGEFEMPAHFDDVAVGIPGFSMRCTFGAALRRARHMAHSPQVSPEARQDG